MKLLLHACCGPCSLEPVRLLQAAGHNISIYYANSNIAPQAEYTHRLDTLRTWAAQEHIPVIEGTYDPERWEVSAGRIADSDDAPRDARCRACYRFRLEETARYAADHGFEGIGTTLSVSPYQYTEIIREELERASAQVGLAAVFEDYRPYYPRATQRSRDLGMYRQNYCGCALSQAEAATQRVERKRERAEAREAERAVHADERAAEEAAREARRAERAAYDAKQAKKHAVLKALREQRRAEEHSD